MATNNTTVRVTKAQKFNAAITLLNGGEPVTIPGKDGKEGVTMDATYLCEFFKSELALLEKKNTSDKKPTKTQEENKVYKEKIVEFLSTKGEGQTCTDIQKGVPEFADMNNQKISALMRQLLDANEVTKAIVKGKALFSIA